MALARRRVAGSTLIELVITIAIVAIVLAAGLPAMSTWIGNVRARNAADGLQNALRLGQSEAVRRNASVSLTLTADSTPGTGSSASGTGINWVLKDAGGNLIQAKGTEGQNGVTMATKDSSGAAYAFAGVVTFDGLGRTDQSAVLQFEFSASGGDHPMRVWLTPAGRVRMCDPVRSSGDPQACE